MQASFGIFSSYTALDADASSFINTAGITDVTQKGAINTLVLSAKSNGWWTKCSAIYPFVGGDATKHSYNLKNPSLYQLSFNGGWTHSSTGALPNGTTGYADTGINVSTVLTLGDTHLSYYSRNDTSSATAKKEWGAYLPGGSDDGIQILIKFDEGSGDTIISDMYNLTGGSSTRASTTNTTSSGHFIASRPDSTNHAIYRNGSQLINNASGAGGSLVNLNLYLGALNQNGTAVSFTDKECAMFTIGLGLSSGLASTMYTNIQTFQTTLSRQV